MEIKGFGAEPCVDSVEKNIDKIQPRDMPLAGVLECIVYLVVPGFAEAMFAAQEVIKVFDGMLACNECMRREFACCSNGLFARMR
jgi:hypothetical protein